MGTVVMAGTEDLLAARLESMIRMIPADFPLKVCLERNLRTRQELILASAGSPKATARYWEDVKALLDCYLSSELEEHEWAQGIRRLFSEL